MKLNTSAWLGGVAGLVAALACFAPAQWLASGIESASDGKVLLTQARGTVWSGSAQLVLAGGEGSAGALALPSRLSWQLTPVWLGAELALQAPCCIPTKPDAHGLQASIVLQGMSSAAWRVSGRVTTLPAQLLSGLGSPWNTLQLAGDLGLDTNASSIGWSGVWSFDKGLQSLAGSANIEALQLQTALSTVRPLGSYRITLMGSQLQLQTISPDDALQLSGTGELLGQPRFSGEALASIGREAALSNLLHIIGQRQTSSDGRMRSALTLEK